MTTPPDSDEPPNDAGRPDPIIDPMMTGGGDPRDVLFDTEKLRGELKKRTSRGGGITIIAQAVQFLSSIASMMYLGRVLTPAEFGVIAMAYSIILPALEIRGFGIPQAMVQRKTMNAAEGRSLFYYNFKLQMIVTVVIALLAWPAAWFYKDPRVFELLLVFDIAILSMGLSVLHHGLLRRQMRFGTAAGIELAADLIGALIACIAAWQGAGYWSLVWLHVGSQTVRSVGFWVSTRWLPGLPKKGGEAAVADMRRYSQSVTGSKAIEQVLAKLDQILIGRFAGDFALGNYNRAFNWSILPVRQLYFPLQQVVVSGASRLLDEPERFRNYLCRGWSATHAMVIPLMLWLIVASGDFIRVLLGKQWDSAVPIFRVLVLGGLMGSTVYLTRWLYLAEGTTGRQLKWTAWSAPVLAVGVVAGLLVGKWYYPGSDDADRVMRAFCVAWGFTVSTSLTSIPRVFNATRDSRVSAHDYWTTVWRPLTASLFAAVPCAWIQFIALKDTMYYWRAPAVLVLFGVVYGTSFLLLPGGRQAVKDLVHIFRSMK